MKQGRTLMELAEEVQRQADAKRDFVLDTRDMEMVQHVANTNNLQLQFGTNGNTMFPTVDNTCHQQIGTHLGIPNKYYQKMLTESPHLLCTNVNAWFNKQPTKRMVRTLDTSARAFLSDRYRVLDNDEVLAVALKAMGEIPHDINVASCEVTSRKLYLKCTIPSLVRDIKQGDPVEAGFIISNSEVGMGALVGQYFLNRLICSNGMIVPEYSMKKHHLGRSTGNGSEGAIEYFKDDTLKADDEVLMLKLRDTLSALANEAHLTAIVGKLQESTEKKVEDPIRAIEEVQKKFVLTNNEKTSVLTKLFQSGDLSQYGIMNAVTAASQDIEDYDRATELEKMGGEIIELNAKDWKVIAEAQAA